MASTYIEYAKGGTDYRTKSTISCWVKRAELGREQYVWGWGENNSSDAYLRFDAADNIEMHCDGGGSTFNTTSLYRDTNAWYHFVFSLDGSNSTANLRRRFWINGVQVDEGMSSISTFSSAVQGWHSTQDLWIGANPRQQQTAGHAYFNGLISHFHYCSNYSYAASDFGSFDSTTGEWKINTSPNVQYGSEGFFLKMEDSSNMDLDSSGNNKTLTTSGTLTATKDNPSNVFCTLNSETGQSTCSYTNGNLKTASTSDGHRIFGTIPSKAGYYEVKLGEHPSGSNGKGFVWGVTDITNYNESNNWNITATRFMKTNYGYDTHFATESFGGGNSWENVTTGLDADQGDILMCAWKNGKVYYGYNGTWFFSANPSNNTDGSTQVPLADSNAYQLPVFKSNLDGANGCEYNFGNGYFGTTAITSNSGNGYQDANGQGKFEYQPPTGCYALCTKNLNL